LQAGFVLILLANCQQICMSYTIAVCTVKKTEGLSETCRILFQNKFEKLVYLVGFIIRIYNDAQSPERQIFSRHFMTLCGIISYYEQTSHLLQLLPNATSS